MQSDYQNLPGPDFLDSVADAEAANGNDINASEYRRRAKQWRQDLEAREEAEAKSPPPLPDIRKARDLLSRRPHAVTPTDHRK
jgi:hypothetical protein